MPGTLRRISPRLPATIREARAMCERALVIGLIIASLTNVVCLYAYL
jgi:hypothetical protein